MQSAIIALEPKPLWEFFAKVSSIPRPSYHENQIIDYIFNWATSKNLKVEKDAKGNLLIKKPASKGMENRKTVLLQAHMDMVAQVVEGVDHDFFKDPLDIYIDGDWIKAKNTTLGADNGLGLASCLAVLDSTDIAHPPLEVLLTVEEETSMAGAMSLSDNWINADILINVDTEEDTSIYLGCAGGIDVNITQSLQTEAYSNQKVYQLSIKNLEGGHSGVDIHLGRGNAIKLLARILYKFNSFTDVQLIDIKGGSVRNTIPRDADAIFAIDANKDINSIFADLKMHIKAESKNIDDNVTITLEEINLTKPLITKQDTKQLINFMNAVPNGVLRYSNEIDDVVETSSNFGIISIENNMLSISLLIRSLIESGKEYASDIVKSLVALTSAKAEFTDPYPGWSPNTNSEIYNIAKQVSKDVLGYEATTKVIHAGLECGVLQGKYPNLDIISIGPTVLNAHTTNEQLSIKGSQNYWNILLGLLKNTPNK